MASARGSLHGCRGGFVPTITINGVEFNDPEADFKNNEAKIKEFLQLFLHYQSIFGFDVLIYILISLIFVNAVAVLDISLMLFKEDSC